MNRQCMVCGEMHTQCGHICSGEPSKDFYGNPWCMICGRFHPLGEPDTTPRPCTVMRQPRPRKQASPIPVSIQVCPICFAVWLIWDDETMSCATLSRMKSCCDNVPMQKPIIYTPEKP